LSSAAVQTLPPDQFGTGSAVNQSIRNLGATLGVALAVAFTSGMSRPNMLAAFHRIWWLLVASGFTVTAFALLFPRRRAEAPAVATVAVGVSS
jgi:hypothetical protein